MTPGSAASGPIPSLDGIRAIAVALVFLAHSGLERGVPGGLGVTIFFVLSGYLITTLMRTEHGKRGHVDWRAFYLRRLLRLMPPLLVVTVLAGLLSALGVIGGGFTLGGALAALLYAGNYFVIAQDYHGLPAGVGVIWSLAIEEHYYLFFPPLAALLLRGHRAAVSAGVLGGLCALVLAWRCWLALQGASQAWMTMATDTRVDAILVGCALALWHNPWLDPAPPRAVRELALAALCVAVLLCTLVVRDETFRVTARYTLQSAAIAGLLWLAVARASQRPWRWLSAPALAYLGSISYTVYLSHHVILLGLARHLPQWGWPALTLAGAALTLLLAEAMRRWVEQPCARLRQSLHRDTPVRPADVEFRLVGTP